MFCKIIIVIVAKNYADNNCYTLRSIASEGNNIGLTWEGKFILFDQSSLKPINVKLQMRVQKYYRINVFFCIV